MKNSLFPLLSIIVLLLLDISSLKAQSGSGQIDTNNVAPSSGTTYPTSGLMSCDNTPQWTKETGTDNIYKCVSDGNVGIGLTTPDVKLDVAGGGGIRARGTGSYSSRQLTLSSSSSNQITATNNLFIASSWGAIILTPSSSHNYVLVQNADLRVNKDLKVDDNVGIGTTSPQAKLDVNGNSIINGNLNLSASQSHIYSANGPLNIQDGSFSNENVIIADNTGNVGIGIDLPQAKLHVNGEASINDKVGIGAFSQPIEKKLHIRSSRSGSGGGQQLLSSGTEENGIRLEDRINTGVGNPNIFSTWDLVPLASETSGESSFRIGMPNTPVITILENENVGIGTTEPEYPLHIELPDDGNLNAVKFEGKRSTNGGHAVRLELAAPNSPAGADKRDFHITNVNSSSGNGNRLNISSVKDDGSTENELLSFNHSGETGIGNINPQAKLHVSGGAVFEGNYGHILLKSTGASSSWSVQSHGGDGALYFRHAPGNYDFYGDYRMRLSNDGNLIVGGKIDACEIEVELTSWCDYVFDESYNLMTLEELGEFVGKHRHLPGIPSEDELLEQGSLKVGKMQKMQMEKIEELTLYILEQNKKIGQLMAKNEEMMGEINELKSKVK